MKSVIQSEKECFICKATYGLEDHHIIYGSANRKVSEKYGLKVWLCKDHHTGQNGVHKHPNTGNDLYLKQLAQKKYEELYGDRQSFIKEFGKSFF